MTTRPVSGGRFLLVDGLRGIAACAVVVFHFYEATRDDLLAYVPYVLDAVLMRGWLGVQIFFVLSGFVIAFSIRNARINASYFGRFVLRRSLRLDPPYWASMALAALISAILLGTAAGSYEQMPSFPQVLSHLVYMQEILGFAHIDSVYWTLCLEVQFYCVLVLLCGLGQRGRDASPTAPLAPWFLAVLFGLLLVSLATARAWLHMPVPGLFVEEWNAFFLGALTWWTLAGRTSSHWLLAAWLLVLGVRFSDGFHTSALIAVLTSLLLFVGGKGRGLREWMDHRVLQYLGRISYSLYVLHPLVGYKLIRWMRYENGGSFSAPEALGAIALALVVTFGLTHLFHLAIEQPAIRLSHRVRMDR